jgi:ELWxxDGT repeat protein
MFMDLNKGKEDSYPHTLTVFKGKLFFVADDGKHGKELWETDGSFDGTKMVVDINPKDSSYAQGIQIFKDFMYFGADDGEVCVFSQTNSIFTTHICSLQHGFELWRSDGTAAGTSLFKEFTPGAADSPIGQIFEKNGHLQIHVGESMYETDGDAVKEISGEL